MDETIEQFEERVLNKRASQLYHLIKTKYDQGVEKLFLSDLTHRNNRKQVIFYVEFFTTFLQFSHLAAHSHLKAAGQAR